MSRTSSRVSIILMAFLAVMLVAIPNSARAAPSDWSNCRQNNYQGGITWAQGKGKAIGQIWQNVTPPTQGYSCLQNIFSLLNQNLGTLMDPFGLIMSALNSFITNILNQVCQQIMSAISGAINLLKSAMCIPLPSMNMSFSLGGGTFGGGSACNGVNLLGALPTSQGGTALPGVWNMLNLQAR